MCISSNSLVGVLLLVTVGTCCETRTWTSQGVGGGVPRLPGTRWDVEGRDSLINWGSVIHKRGDGCWYNQRRLLYLTFSENSW